MAAYGMRAAVSMRVTALQSSADMLCTAPARAASTSTAATVRTYRMVSSLGDTTLSCRHCVSASTFCDIVGWGTGMGSLGLE